MNQENKNKKNQALWYWNLWIIQRGYFWYRFVYCANHHLVFIWDVERLRGRGAVYVLWGAGVQIMSVSSMHVSWLLLPFLREGCSSSWCQLFVYFFLVSGSFSVCLCGGCVVVCNMWYVVSYHKVSQFFCTWQQ